MKLKTLKDIDFVGWMSGREIIKAEAVKWVKEKEFMTEYDFMEFHNITKEDLTELKGGKTK